MNFHRQHSEISIMWMMTITIIVNYLITVYNYAQTILLQDGAPFNQFMLATVNKYINNCIQIILLSKSFIQINSGNSWV